jgi:hypothetical protein
MESGAIVAVTTHGGAAADTATVKETVIEAGMAWIGLPLPLLQNLLMQDRLL